MKSSNQTDSHFIVKVQHFDRLYLLLSQVLSLGQLTYTEDQNKIYSLDIAYRNIACQPLKYNCPVQLHL